MAERMSERIADIAKLTVMEDDRKPFPRHGGSGGKQDTYPPSFS
jgi:hypothetical protein